MILVTGGAGFIGSNLVHALNAAGQYDILLVDEVTPAKAANLEGARFAAAMDKRTFRRALAAGDFERAALRAVLHQGACSDTLADDAAYMMDNNFAFSQELLTFALRARVPLVYASTAAVYGLASGFAPVAANEQPLNVYGRSKLAFDHAVRAAIASGQARSTVVGLRYFNVYGPREQHKGRMASVVQRFTEQLRDGGTMRIFRGSGGFGDGEQRRDFLFVGDVCRMNLFFAGLLPESPETPVQAVVNAGTGVSRSFNEVAATLMEREGKGRVEYVPLPAELAGRYQHFTCADIATLRAAGYRDAFTPLAEGWRLTLEARGRACL